MIPILLRVFFLGDAGTASYKLKVWEGTYNELVSQPISGVVAGWNEFDLDYPVTIDSTKEYKIGYDIVGGIGASIPGYDAGPQINGYGNKAYYWGGWWDITSMNGNWNLAGWVEDAKGNGGYLGKELVSYDVYRNGEIIASPIDTTYLDEELGFGAYNYYVTAIYTEGESEPTNTVQVVLTRINEQNLNSLQLFPNPVSSRVFIEVNSEMDKIQLFNLSGQVVLEQNTSGNNTELNISEFEPGIYFIKVLSHDSIITRKLVIE